MWAEYYYRRGFSALCVTMGGYPGSEGDTSEMSTYLDAAGAVRYCIDKGISESCIIAHGVSIGGALASAAGVMFPGLNVTMDQSFSSGSSSICVMSLQCVLPTEWLLSPAHFCILPIIHGHRHAMQIVLYSRAHSRYIWPQVMLWPEALLQKSELCQCPSGWLTKVGCAVCVQALLTLACSGMSMAFTTGLRDSRCPNVTTDMYDNMSKVRPVCAGLQHQVHCSTDLLCAYHGSHVQHRSHIWR